MKKIMFYVLIVILILLFFSALGLWFFASIFNDTGSTVMQHAFNMAFLLVSIVAATTLFLVFCKTGFIHSDNLRIVITLAGIITMFIVVGFSFIGLNKNLLIEKQKNDNYILEYKKEKLAAMPKDYICGDSSFLSADTSIPNTVGLTYSVSMRTLATVDPIMKTFTVETRDAQTKNLLFVCKNREGKSVIDIYKENQTLSNYIPKTIPITKDEAFQLIKQLKEFPVKNTDNYSVVVNDLKGHDDYDNQDYWLVSVQPPDGNNGLTFYYLVLVENGKIIIGATRYLN